MTRRGKRNRYVSPPNQGTENLPAAATDPVPPQRVRFAQVTAESYAGPLPPPAILRELEEIYPGATKTIIETFYDQSHHRMDIERKVIESDIARSKWGQIIGGVIALASLGAATTAILTGHDIAGTILGGTELIALVSVFVYGDRRRVRERARKENPAK